MNLIFMGTPDFAVETLEALIAAGHTISLVVTQPDKPKGRGNAMSYSAVKEAALKHELPVFQPRKIREPENVEYLKKFAPDAIVVVAFGQILPKEILEMPKYCCVNVHASLLPKYRGAAPIQWAVINGEKYSGVTTMRMDEGLDTGDMIMTEVVELDKEETGGSLFDRLAVVGAKLCVKTLAALEDGTAVFTPQNHAEATKVGLIRKQFGRMDFSKSAKELEQLIRGLNPWPSAYTYLNGKMLKVWKAEVVTETEAAGMLSGVVEVTAKAEPGTDGVTANAEPGSVSRENVPEVEPGTVIGTTKKTIFVQTGDGVLSLLEVQLEGKKRMETAAFLLGQKVEAGTKLGE